VLDRTRAALVLGWLAVLAFAAPAGADTAPATIVLDGERLAAIREHPDPHALAILRQRADRALTAGRRSRR
jgi:hypothetical protein